VKVFGVFGTKVSGDNAIDICPSSDFWKKQEVSVKKKFIKHFLSKKIFQRFAPAKRRGISIALSLIKIVQHVEISL
jgi:hypothetical protein